ncbi:hypothetical protein K1719_006808 [Acacia pycnantha]|nr:hypothetical protein K1719_006808 [Acacia pycnantha]
MQPPVSFDANLKSDPPPHPGDDQSSKRAKLDEPQPHDDIMEADLPSETPSPIDHASATLTTECVPETQMNLETFPESPQTYQDLPMSDNTANAGQKEAPSFKDKLLNSVSKAGAKTKTRSPLPKEMSPLEQMTPGLPTRYYHKSVIESIGGVFGKLSRTPSVCFHAGVMDICGKHVRKMAVVNTDSSENHQPKEVCASTKAKQARETALFGDWMQVQRRRRTTGAGGRKNDANGSTAVITSSRYERRKGKEVKGVKKNDPVYKQKIPDPQTKKQISSPKPPVYAEKTSATTLDKDRNSAVIITDPRLPQNSQPYPNNIGLPPLKAHHAMDNDPHSKSRGIKLASGLTIHNVGVKPNFDDAGPSVNHMKELAKDIQSALGGADSEMMFIHMEVLWKCINSSFLFTAVYGSPQEHLRKYLWEDLAHLAIVPSSPWLLAGDFNAILSHEERKGGSSRSSPVSKPFRFLAPWLVHPDFSAIVQRHWNSGENILKCVDSFTDEITRWNSETFGGIGKRKRKFSTELKESKSNWKINRMLPLIFL